MLFFFILMTSNKVFIDYPNLHRWSQQLIQDIQNTNLSPTCIVSIAMGGLAIGYHLTKGLWVSRFHAIHTRSYIDQTQWNLEILSPIPNLAGQRVLLVDDLVDSGHTLSYLYQKISWQVESTHTAVWVYKDHSIFIPDFFVKTYQKEWIEFPYEEFEKMGEK